MKETQRRIKEYQAKLPRMKEKVLAVLLLLAMSTSMLITVSFAWVALSTNPEVTGVNTSIASNGNLEIALASGTMDNPTVVSPSAVGDSALPLLQRNVTWGNLINLSDPAYGLDSLVLRPSLLNEANLLERPLHGPVYDGSGRVIDMNTNFGYAALKNGVFETTNQLGVRAITSMKYGTAGVATKYNNKLDIIEAANTKSQLSYMALANTQAYMDALASMMAGYMVENIFLVHGSSTIKNMVDDATLVKSDVEQFANMYSEMIICFEEQAAVFASLLTLSAEVEAGEGGAYPTITASQLLALSYDTSNKTAYKELKNRGFLTLADSDKTVTVLKEIDQFLADYNTMVADYARLQYLVTTISGRSVAWKRSQVDTQDVNGDLLIDNIIENLVDVGECTITGGNYTNLKVKNATGGSIALNLMNAGVCETKITNGILYRFDNRSGARLANPSGKPLTMTVPTSIGSKSITSNVSTSATQNYFENERSYISDRIKVKFGAAVLIANDSYGFAVDFWVRTNAQNSYLTLQGNVLTRTDTVEVFGKDLNGVEVPLYTITVKAEAEGEGEGEGGGVLDNLMVVNHDIYRSTYENDSEETIACWRYAETHAIVEDEYVSEYDDQNLPPRKVETITTVIGYEGDNRVWEGDEHSILTVNSSTQGSGSCYVFYSENPVDQARIKELLKSMKVAFVDDQGVLLAKASMNVDLSYESTGKVIVPLVLDSDSLSFGVDNNGNPTYAITVLESNVPKRITALVYLDGEQVTNEHVLASADIRGQMNIQFGSSVLLKAQENEELYNSEIHIDAEIDGQTEFEYGVDNNMTTKVKVSIDGVTPAKVEAYFIRKINATQGSPETVFTLTPTDQEGVYEGTYTFQYPGEYILRSIRVDGSDRELQLVGSEAYPTVMVKGHTITNVTYSERDGADIMTGAASHSVTSTLSFATNDPDKMPTEVVGQFMRKDGAVATVNYSYNSTTGVWSGVATFVSSGEYTMQYVMLDGKYTELNEANRITLNLTLGMRVRVYTDSPTTIIYGDESAPESLLMRVEILDNNGDPIASLGRVSMNYSASGSEDLYTALNWNSNEGHYEGEFHVESGIWRFKNVVVTMGEGEGKRNTLTAVNADAPVFTIIPPTPPSYYQTLGQRAQFVTSGKGRVNVTLWESESATVYAKFIRLDNSGNPIAGSETYVKSIGMTASEANKDGEITENYTYTFEVPASGRWQLVSVSTFNVFDENQTMRPMPEDGEVDTADEYERGIVFEFEPFNVAVLTSSDIRVDLEYADDTFASTTTEGITTIGNFGKDSNGTIKASFMDSHTLGAGKVTAKFSDSYGLIKEGVFTISNISMTYDYSAHDTKYGGYSATSTTSQEFLNNFTIQSLNFSGEKGTYTNGNAIAFQYAAQYALKENMSYTVTGSNGTASASQTITPTGAYKIEVWSNKPTVKITSVGPTSTTTEYRYYTSNPAETSSIDFIRVAGTLNRKVDDYNAALYIYCLTDDSLRDGQQMVPQLPTIDLELIGVPNSITSASIAFGNASNSSYARTFTFSNMKVNDAKIGGKTNGAYDGDYSWTIKTYPGVYPAGSQTVDKISITYNGVEFDTSLSHGVTINNPLYPPYVDFAVNDSTFTGTVPGRIYATPQADGTYTVKLPTVASWDVDASQTLSSLPTDISTLTPSTSTSKYTQYSGGYINGTWTKYDVTTKVYTAPASTKTWKVRHQVVEWTDGTNTGLPGETITITRDTILTAVIDTSYTHSESTSTLNYKRTVITIVTTTESGKSYNRPSGYTNAAPPSAGDSGWVLQN